MPPVKTKLNHRATVYVYTCESIDVDIDELAKECGANARGNSFIADYAIGNRSSNGIVLSTEIKRYTEKVSFYE